MPTYRLTIEYEGTRYHGWQGQSSVKTVSGELRRAIEDVVPVVDLGGAGRTDAGVHARAQTAHLRLQKAVDAEQFRRDVNDRLPADIHVLAVLHAPERFHARHDARSRSYIYQISTRRTAFGKRFVWWVRAPLNRAEMARGAAAFVGRHDYRRFCEKPTDQPSTLVEVERIEISEDGDLLLIRIVASHFLWKMVRRMVGTLVRLGAGELTTRELQDLLDPKLTRTAPGTPAEWTAPAAGLFLERVLYDGEPPLSAVAAPVPVHRLAPEPTGKTLPLERGVHVGSRGDRVTTEARPREARRAAPPRGHGDRVGPPPPRYGPPKRTSAGARSGPAGRTTPAGKRVPPGRAGAQGERDSNQSTTIPERKSSPRPKGFHKAVGRKKS